MNYETSIASDTDLRITELKLDQPLAGLSVPRRLHLAESRVGRGEVWAIGPEQPHAQAEGEVRWQFEATVFVADRGGEPDPAVGNRRRRPSTPRDRDFPRNVVALIPCERQSGLVGMTLAGGAAKLRPVRCGRKCRDKEKEARYR